MKLKKPFWWFPEFHPAFSSFHERLHCWVRWWMAIKTAT
jgi:hypothetical protein